FFPLLQSPTSNLFPYTTLFRSRMLTSAVISRWPFGPAGGRLTTTDPSAEPSSRTGVCGTSLVRLAVSSLPSVRSTLPPTLGLSRSEEHTSELQSQSNLVCRLLL